MPWSEKQRRLAQAVKHGFKPTGAAKGFTGTLADLILAESPKPKKEKR